MGKIIGIDLGTGCSVCSVREGNETKVIVNATGSRITPSVVAFTDEGRLVGQPAKSQASVNPTRTLASVKRLIGRRRSEVAFEEKIVPYKLVGAPDELVQIEVDGKRYFPQQISAMILQELKRSAEAYLGETVDSAVISVPAYYNDSQRSATKDAGEIAGLKVLRIINEPTAAALAYGLDKNKNQKILICDFGSGTDDVSVLEVGDGVFEVIATSGDMFLGGDDFDQALVDYISDEFKKTNEVDIRDDPTSRQRLREACEKAKCDLSVLPETIINLPYISKRVVNGVQSPLNLQRKINRSEFERVTEKLFNRLRPPIEQAMKDSGLKYSDIDEVVLVGGSSRMPKVTQICKELFGGKEPCKGVNPDEVVSIGCALQAAILSGEVHDIVLVDVTPLSLGLETLGGVVAVVVPRGQSIPTTATQVFSTATDDQPTVDIHVLQGERKMATDNRTLGKFALTGIPMAKRGVPQIEVTFDIDVNGIVKVSARDKATGREQKIEIKSSSGLDKSDIEKMVREAKANEIEDKKKSDIAEFRNKADNAAYSLEKTLKENPDLSGELRASAEAAIADTRAKMGGTDAKPIEEALVGLSRIGDQVYAAILEAKKVEQPAA